MNGTIIKALSGFYYVSAENSVYECRARGKFRLDGTSPLVGDRVSFAVSGNGKGYIEKISEIILQLMLINRLHHFNLKRGKARRICNERILIYGKKFNVPRGMPSAAELFAHLADFKLKLRNDRVQYA